MVTLKNAAVLALALVAGGCVVERVVYYPLPPAAAPAAPVVVAPPPPQPVQEIRPDPQMVQSGQVRLSDVSDQTLETLVRDVNDRKDKAIKAHDGAPSEEAEYLWRVLGDVRTEFTRRGYTFDAQGNCFHGDQPVKLWWDAPLP